MAIISLIVQMLHSHGRIASSRINLISEIGENCYDESDLANKCMKLFANACTVKEYGNGRFVRNLIEQAMLRQAQRLMAGHKSGDISKASVERLKATDFDVNIEEIFNRICYLK